MIVSFATAPVMLLGLKVPMLFAPTSTLNTAAWTAEAARRVKAVAKRIFVGAGTGRLGGKSFESSDGS
jgi:hypothetical protein